MEEIVLSANPGSTSRKYALFKGKKKLLELHFEVVQNKVICLCSNGEKKEIAINHVAFSATQLPKLIQELMPEIKLEDIRSVGLRLVAPSTFFQKNHTLSKAVIDQLEDLKTIAPLHVNASLSEYALLKNIFPKANFMGISDSAFLAHKPEKAMFYGIPSQDTQELDIKRFGYHGLSLESVAHQLKQARLLPQRLVVCHLGGGVSVAAIHRGKVIESSMGYSPLEGALMATRSGSIDLVAYERIKKHKNLRSSGAYMYLNNTSGLLGVSGVSSDIRELLAIEKQEPQAKLALDMYVYKIQQAVGTMAATMSGIDGIAFTGTVGERSPEIRKRILSKMLYLGLMIDRIANKKAATDESIRAVGKKSHPAKIYVVHADENAQIVHNMIS